MANDCGIDLSKMQPVDSLKGDDPTDTNLLREMARSASDFICGQEWCERLDRQFLAYGIGGVVAVFFVQIEPRSEDVDRCLWVVVGDVPPAYIVIDDNPTPAEALDAYCSEMANWVHAVENGESVDELIPVNAPPTRENAQQLAERLDYIRSTILPLAQAV